MIFNALLWLIIVLAGSGCTTPTAKIIANLPEKGNVVNGRESIEGRPFAFLTRGEALGGFFIVEFDGKPFFVEYRSPAIMDHGKWLKVASPFIVDANGQSAPLVFSAGKHTVTVKYQELERSFVNTLFTYPEKIIEFVAEGGHGYEISANTGFQRIDKSKPAIRFWNPTITDRDAKAVLK